MKWFYIIGWFPTAFAILGNALVIFIIVRRSTLQTVPNWFVMSLAVADFAVGTLFFPLDFFCNYLEVCPENNIGFDVAILAIYSSITNLCAMTADRYVAIVKPLRYQVWMTTRRSAFVIGITWIFTFMVDFIPVVCVRLGRCEQKNKAIVLTRLIFFTILPCFFLIVATTQILVTARTQRQRNVRLEAQLKFNQPDHRLARTKHFSSTRVIVTIVAIFFFCYSLEIYSFGWYFFRPFEPSLKFRHLLNLFIVVNSAANPIAYALLKRDIRLELKFLIFRRKRSHQDADLSIELEALNRRVRANIRNTWHGMADSKV